MKLLRAALCAAILCAALRMAAAQGNLLPLPQDTPIRGMHFPALSPDGKTLCFEYLGDLWTVPAAGGVATRLTVSEAYDAWPRWSPDGRWIVFASNREGNFDLFVMPSEGGPARQLTFYTTNEYPMDWSPDGTKILFYGLRGVENWQLYALDIKTGVVKTLTHDDQSLRFAAYSPDGGTVAYTRGNNIILWWRPRYHGSANYDIYTRNLTTGRIIRISDYDGMDIWPMWSADGRLLYYVSDQLTPGTPNLVYRLASGSGKPALLTKHSGDAVRWPGISRDGSTIAYEYGGDLWSVKTAGGAPQKLTIYARSDDKTNPIRRLNLTGGATEAEITPDGKTLALVVRGDLWTIPSDKGGDATRLTNNPANDYDITWSPDGKKIVFASDRKGNFDIYTVDVNTKEEKVISEDPNDENSPQFSPDGKSIAFLRSGSQSGIYIASADGTGTPRRVAESEGNNLFNVGIQSYVWSPDSKWIAFSRRDALDTIDVWVVPAAGGKEVNITYYPGVNGQPMWTSDGKYLLFISTRDGGSDLYSLPLQREKEEQEEQKTAPPAPNPGGAGAQAKPAEKKPVEVKIDFDDIENRAKRLTTQGATAFAVTPDGKSAVFVSASGGAPDFYSVPVGGGTATRLTTTGEGTNAPRFASDPNKFWVLGAGGTVKAISRVGPMWLASPIAFSARLELDRRAEIRQAFNEFWRRMNVGFYDPKMHGVDWKAVRAKYEPLLPFVDVKEDFTWLLSMMVGELNASHSEIGPPPGPPGPSVAELGMTFDENYAGPGLKVTDYLPKGPDDDLGPKVKPGEYILQMDGEDVAFNEQLWPKLYDRAGKTVELLVTSTPPSPPLAKGGPGGVPGARTVKIKPVTYAQWRDLEYQRKVKEAREEVDRLSGGRLAYIRIRAMDQASMKQMERELWGKAEEKEGLALDIRNNGGGSTHDEILAQLSRVAYGYTQPRDGLRSTQPVRRWGKPIVLLINENSASDAEIFPNGFRTLKLGKIVGEPTPGYVIGTYSGTLQDGTSYRIPMWGWFTLDGKDMENNGVKPDITVEPTPEDIAARRDRQLEVAVQTLLKELPKK
jgi:tricorn protease